MQRSWGREQAGLFEEPVAQAGRAGVEGGQGFARNFRKPGDQFEDNI